ncbi:MAG: hypothetical protein H8E44_19995 [Planctomycetes bacterium]|nr:hypothetical protein [Planctomycetota bacterium]MBL7037806.1 hypothetical protein [Pirellulaceae bacterium]
MRCVIPYQSRLVAAFMVGAGLLSATLSCGRNESTLTIARESRRAADAESTPASTDPAPVTADPMPMNTDPPEADLHVLVVSPSQESKVADGIKELLEDHGMAVTTVTENAVAVEQVQQANLVILVGGGRYTKFRREFDTAVLGYGSYGCAYFGNLHLKNGRPYT